MKKLSYPAAAGVLCLLLGGCSASGAGSAVLILLGVAVYGLYTFALK